MVNIIIVISACVSVSECVDGMMRVLLQAIMKIALPLAVLVGCLVGTAVFQQGIHRSTCMLIGFVGFCRL